MITYTYHTNTKHRYLAWVLHSMNNIKQCKNRYQIGFVLKEAGCDVLTRVLSEMSGGLTWTIY